MSKATIESKKIFDKYSKETVLKYRLGEITIKK